MKQAKFALTAVAVLAVIGGALAFKANRSQNHFYSLTTTNLNGQVVKGCVGQEDLFYAPQVGGTIKLTYVSSTTLIPATTCIATVRNNG